MHERLRDDKFCKLRPPRVPTAEREPHILKVIQHLIGVSLEGCAVEIVRRGARSGVDVTLMNS